MGFLSKHVGADQHNTFLGYRKSPGVICMVLPNDGVIRNPAAFVDDGPADAAFSADTGFWQDYGPQEFRALRSPGHWRTAAIGARWRLKRYSLPETMELVALPVRPGSSRMNLAGGSCSW